MLKIFFFATIIFGGSMNKIVVITGASSGIGLALKQKFEADGNIVYSLSRSSAIEGENFLECDVTQEDQVKQCIEKIKNEQGRIDVLVNCAGYGLFGATELLPLKEVQRQVDTNFMGVVAVTKYALPLMSSGGKIYNISSACALFPLPYRNIYCASKSAVSSFSEGLRMELKPLGIYVTDICPGDVKTPFVQNRVKFFETNDRYADRIENASEKVEKGNDKRMTIEYATKKIYKIMNKSKPKFRYIIGIKYKFLNFALRFFPKSLYLKIVEKHFGGHKK